MLHRKLRRKLVTRSPKRVVGAIGYPAKCPDLVEYESFLERDAIFLLLFYPTIANVASFQELVTYADESGHARNAYPDLKVTTVEGETYIVEVKPLSKALAPETLSKLRALERHFKDRGITYLVLTDGVIEAAPRLANVKLAMRYRGMEPATSEVQAVREIFISQSTATLGELSGALGEQGLQKAYGLLCRGQLRADLNLPLKADSPVTASFEPHQQLSHAELFQSARVDQLKEISHA